MKRLYSWDSAILSGLAGKPFKGLAFKGLGLVLNQTIFYWLKRLKKKVLFMRFKPMTKGSIENNSFTKPTWLVC